MRTGRIIFLETFERLALTGRLGGGFQLLLARMATKPIGLSGRHIDVARRNRRAAAHPARLIAVIRHRRLGRAVIDHLRGGVFTVIVDRMLVGHGSAASRHRQTVS